MLETLGCGGDVQEAKARCRCSHSQLGMSRGPIIIPVLGLNLKTKKSMKAAALLINLNKRQFELAADVNSRPLGVSQKPGGFAPVCPQRTQRRHTTPYADDQNSDTECKPHVFRGDLVAILRMCRLNIALNSCHQFHVSCHNVLFIGNNLTIDKNHAAAHLLKEEQLIMNL